MAVNLLQKPNHRLLYNLVADAGAGAGAVAGADADADAAEQPSIALTAPAVNFLWTVNSIKGWSYFSLALLLSLSSTLSKQRSSSLTRSTHTLAPLCPLPPCYVCYVLM